MKKFILTTIFLICILLGINANNTLKFNNNYFDKDVKEIIVNVPSNIYFYQGDTFGINIRTFDEDLYNQIKYEIKDNKLYIDFNKFYDHNVLLDPDNIRINIQTPVEIKKIKTNSELVAIEQKHHATNNGKN